MHSITCHARSQTFRARLKAIATGVSFYDTKGQSVDMLSFIADVKNFDPDAVDDDLGALPAANFERKSGKAKAGEIQTLI